MKYIKKFENNAEYTAYTASPDFITPNVSYLESENEVKMTPYTPQETRVVAKFNVTDTSNPTKVVGTDWGEVTTSAFSEIEIDGVVQPSVTTGYTFSTTGEHTVKYTLTDPTELGEFAFTYCTSLSSITIPNSVTSIGNCAFNSCFSLTSITIPNSVTSISYVAFGFCYNLQTVTIGSGVTSIGDDAFYRCISLTSINIPNSVTSIGNNAFNSCGNLSSVTIPDSVTTIGQNVFNMAMYEGEAQLTSCTIGSGVTSIGGGGLFESCDNLQSVTIYATTPPEIIGEEQLIVIPNDAPIYVPAESVDAYKAADVWMDFEDRIQAIV